MILNDDDRKILARVIASSALATAQIELETGELGEDQRERIWGLVMTFWCRLHGDDAACTVWFDKAQAYEKELGPRKMLELWKSAEAEVL